MNGRLQPSAVLSFLECAFVAYMIRIAVVRTTPGAAACTNRLPLPTTQPLRSCTASEPGLARATATCAGNSNTLASQYWIAI